MQGKQVGEGSQVQAKQQSDQTHLQCLHQERPFTGESPTIVMKYTLRCQLEAKGLCASSAVPEHLISAGGASSPMQHQAH
jgi:hypothetical protein